MSASKKPHLNIVVVGHVDNGKSTTVGHLLVDLGAIDQRTIDAYAKESEATGKGDTFKYAWVMDSIKDERDRGITIDLAFQKFETNKFFFTLIDAPGHKDFIKNMSTGASEADAAILVISVKQGETEAAIEPGGQGREHAFLAKTLGVGQVVVALNKMDDVGYQEARFKEVKESVEKMLKSVGFNTAKVNFVPVSGWKGDNLIKKSENMPWYKGVTLAEALDAFEPPEWAGKKSPTTIPSPEAYSPGSTPTSSKQHCCPTFSERIGGHPRRTTRPLSADPFGCDGGEFPSRPGRPDVGLLQCIEDEPGLSLGVGDAVISISPGEFSLQTGVCLADGPVGPEVVAEEEVGPLPVASRLADVDLHGPLTCSGMSEVAVSLSLPCTQRHTQVLDRSHV